MRVRVRVCGGGQEGVCVEDERSVGVYVSVCLFVCVRTCVGVLKSGNVRDGEQALLVAVAGGWDRMPRFEEACAG